MRLCLLDAPVSCAVLSENAGPDHTLRPGVGNRNPVLWDLVATFTEEDDAENFITFMNGTYPAILATEYGQCSSVLQQSMSAMARQLACHVA